MNRFKFIYWNIQLYIGGWQTDNQEQAQVAIDALRGRL